MRNESNLENIQCFRFWQKANHLVKIEVARYLQALTEIGHKYNISGNGDIRKKAYPRTILSKMTAVITAPSMKSKVP